MMSAASDIEPFDVPRFREQPNLEVETKGWEYFAPLMWLELNHRVKPLDDVRVRQAISMALDRDFILQPAVVRRGQGGDRPGRLHHPLLRPVAEAAPHDVKKATALLDEAGLKPDARASASRSGT